jgi:endo-1,4-beta-xylanase
MAEVRSVRLVLLPLSLVCAVMAALGCTSSPAAATSATVPAPPRPLLGAAVNWARLQGPGPYQRLFLEHFHALTPENEFKMEALSPAPGRLDFTQADAIMGWADAHGIAVHGHTLVWGQQLPQWLTSRSWSRAELRGVLRWYVTGVVRHFRGRVATWDVVNEPLADDGSLRRSLWRRVLGPQYVALALRWAHAADPSARLLVNDYGIERAGRKADAMVALLRVLRSTRVPVDGVGLQSHLTTSWAPTATDLAATMRRYAALGLEVDVSELDVGLPAARPTAAALAAQARIYGVVARACRLQPACRRVTTWGFTDASTWLGTDRRPLPFAVDGTAKPAWAALQWGLR